MSDVVISRSPRTYPMPQSVVDEAKRGIRWQRAYGTKASEVADWLSGFLSAGGAVTGEMVGILASLAPRPSESIGSLADPDYPNPARIEWSLSGGAPLQTWLKKVTASMQKSQEAATASALDMIGFDPKNRRYLGVCDARDDCIVRDLVTVASGSSDDWLKWDGEQKRWNQCDQDSIRKFEAVELDRDLVAFTAAALSERGVEGVRLVFAAPSAYLPFQPITAAAPANVSGTHYYAVVDSTDTSAVMDLISISPGPVVQVRDKGKWTDGSKTLALLTGISPPPLVELDDKMLKMVMAQIDGTFDAAAVDPDYVESLGNEDEIEKKKKEDFDKQQAEFAARKEASKASAGAAEPSPKTSKKPLTAGLQALYEERDSTMRLLQHAIEGAKIEEVNRRAAFDNKMMAIRAGGAFDEDGLEADRRTESSRREQSATILAGLERERSIVDLRYRKQIAREAIRASAAARSRLAVLETLAEAVAVSAGGQSRNGSEVLRQYWTKEAGALKVKFGVGGDVGRCVRHVSKYVGTRASAICNERTS
jgi:hypothetical protein